MDVISWLPPHCTQVPWAIFIWERNEQTSGVSWFWQVAFWKPCSAFLATIAQAGLSRVESLDFGWYFELFGAQGHCQHGGLRLCTRWSCDWRQWSREAFWCGWVCMWLWQLDQGLDQWGFHLLCLGYYPFKWAQLSLLTWPSFVDSSTQQLQSESFALVGHQVQLICEHLCVCEQKITGEFLLWWHISWLCGGRELIVDDHSFAHVSFMRTWSLCGSWAAHDFMYASSPNYVKCHQLLLLSQDSHILGCLWVLYSETCTADVHFITWCCCSGKTQKHVWVFGHPWATWSVHWEKRPTGWKWSVPSHVWTSCCSCFCGKSSLMWSDISVWNCHLSNFQCHVCFKLSLLSMWCQPCAHSIMVSQVTCSCDNKW